MAEDKDTDTGDQELDVVISGNVVEAVTELR